MKGKDDGSALKHRKTIFQCSDQKPLIPMALARPAPVPMQGKAVARETHLQGFMPVWGGRSFTMQVEREGFDWECRTTIFQGSDSKALTASGLTPQLTRREPKQTRLQMVFNNEAHCRSAFPDLACSTARKSPKTQPSSTRQHVYLAHPENGISGRSRRGGSSISDWLVLRPNELQTLKLRASPPSCCPLV